MSNGKKLTKRWIKKKNNDCFWMENIFCLESHIHLCSRHTSAIPAYVIKTCVTWHAISGTRYWGFVSPKLHISTYRNQQHCWWFHNRSWLRHKGLLNLICMLPWMDGENNSYVRIHVWIVNSNIIKWPCHESDHPMNMTFTLHGNTLNSHPWYIRGAIRWCCQYFNLIQFWILKYIFNNGYP